MKNKKHLIENSPVLWWIFGGCAITTLYFNSKIQDPFNSPKMWIIMVIAAWLVGHIFANKNKSFQLPENKIFLALLGSFALCVFVAALTTDLIYTAFFGDNQRRNGFLTYLALIVFMLAASIYVKLESLKRLNYVAFFTGLILATYGLLQISGLDFIEWNNPYNAVISTVGNPNFAAAVMAMMASIVFGPVINKSFNIYYRLLSMILTVVLLITIYLSDARQGLIAFGVGIGCYIIVWLYSLKSRLRHFLLGSSITIGLFSILGMLQIGPLTSIFYKGSVTVRGYYWRAGIEMFKDQPFFGVGVDRYGAYFKEFREVGYPLNYGFNITSSNAHNVPIQIFSTSGAFAGISYLAIIGFIAWRGIHGIRSRIGDEKLVVASIFSAWLAYQAQSIISIDNIGISIWGWMLGGAVVGVSRKGIVVKVHERNSLNQTKKNTAFNLRQTFISSTTVALSLAVIVPQYQSEKNMFETRMRFNPQVVENKSTLYDYASKTLKTPLLEPAYKLNVGNYLVATGFTAEGLDLLKSVISSDPRNLDALTYLSDFNQQLGNLEEVNKYRLQIAKYDPYNAINYLQLGRNYKVLGNKSKMIEMRTKILSFAQNTQEAKQAISELN